MRWDLQQAAGPEKVVRANHLLQIASRLSVHRGLNYHAGKRASQSCYPLLANPEECRVWFRVLCEWISGSC